MHHRSGSWVKGHYRNGTWVSSHSRSATCVINGNISAGSIVSAPENGQEYTFLKRYFRLKTTPFIKDSKYINIDSEIKKVIFIHLPYLKTKKLENKKHLESFMSYLEKFIIDNIESELLEIDNIQNFYTKLKDILQIVYIFILYEVDSYYKLTYISDKEKETIGYEEVIKIMKNIIQKNMAILSRYYNQNDWEYQRNKFFDQEVKNRIYNPKIALHVLFKKVCKDNLIELRV